jgi:excisionase family DNA binding protein
MGGVMKFDLTVENVADEFGVNEQTIRRMILDGRLPAAKVGAQYRLNREQVNIAFKVPETPKNDNK